MLGHRCLISQLLVALFLFSILPFPQQDHPSAQLWFGLTELWLWPGEHRCHSPGVALSHPCSPCEELLSPGHQALVAVVIWITGFVEEKC